MSKAGYRSPSGLWIGGAAGFPFIIKRGYRSLLAFWLGGAWKGKTTPTPPVPVVAKVDDGRRWGPSTVIYREGEISYWWERRQRVEDEEIILL
jgi:hypothetical protein